MAEFTGGNEKCISAREPIVFENKTESKYEVCAGIVFHKSGIYEVSVTGNRTIVSEVPKRKTGKWMRTRTVEHDGELYCDQCGQEHPEQKLIWNYCPNCGADMRTAKYGTK